MSKLFTAFHYFDPLKGEIPSVEGFPLDSLVKRARHLLKGRRRKEIDYALASLLWMIDQGRTRTLVHQVETGLLDWEVQDYAERASLSEAQVLLHHMRGFDITGQPNLKQANWPEYFATLTLAYIGNMVVCQQEALTPQYSGELDTASNVNECASHSCTRATEALAIAEALTSASPTTSPAPAGSKLPTALRVQYAAITRWSRSNKIKEEFVLFYYAGKYHSVAEAARIYYENLSAADRRILCPSGVKKNAVRTLQEKIKAHKRSTDPHRSTTRSQG
jgi:hypothetical protein